MMKVEEAKQDMVFETLKRKARGTFRIWRTEGFA